MATYRQRQLNARDRKIDRDLSAMPGYAREYMEDLKDRSPQTRYTYLFDLKTLLEYIKKEDSSLIDTDLKDIPVTVFSNLKTQDMEKFLSSFKTRDRVTGKMQDASPSYKARKYSSLKRFYKFLLSKGYALSNPFEDSTRPEQKGSGPIALSDEEITLLLEGVKRNDQFLLEGTDQDGINERRVLPITEEIALKRERQVSRNVCILTILLYGGLTVSEIASLNLESIEEDGIRYERRNATPGFITMCKEIRESLDEYLQGTPVPEELKNRQTVPSFEKLWDFCMDNKMKPNIRVNAVREFGISDEDFLSDVLLIAHYCRIAGRKAFKPIDAEKALFLTNSGHRISIRMIQDMVLDMTRTYLPSLTRKQNFSPAKLRSARLLNLMQQSSMEEALVQNMGLNIKYARSFKEMAAEKTRSRMEDRSMLCDEKILNVFTGEIQSNRAISNYYFDCYDGITLHVTYGARYILETEELFVSMDSRGVIIEEKGTNSIYDLAFSDELIEPIDFGPLQSYETLLFTGQKLLKVSSTTKDKYHLIFNTFEMDLIVHDDDEDFPSFRTDDPSAYRYVYGYEKRFFHQCRCGGKGQLLLDFNADYTVRCDHCKMATNSIMDVQSAIDEWEKGANYYDLSGIVIE